MTFSKWLDTLVEEKGYDIEMILSVEGPEWGTNDIPLGVLLTFMKQAPAHEQRAIKTMVVRIDFANGDVLDYFRHLAQAIAL